MSIATVNQLYNYTTSRDQHAFLPVLTTYIETDHKWQMIPPTTNQQGAHVSQTTFNIPTTLGELLGTMILHFDIVITSGTLAAAAEQPDSDPIDSVPGIAMYQPMDLFAPGTDHRSNGRQLRSSSHLLQSVCRRPDVHTTLST